MVISMASMCACALLCLKLDTGTAVARRALKWPNLSNTAARAVLVSKSICFWMQVELSVETGAGWSY